MTCHYSGVLFRLPPSTPPPGRAIGFLDAPSARARGCADHFEVYPTLNTDGHGNGAVAMIIGMKHNNSPTAHSIGGHAEVMPTMETDCGCHFSVCQPTPSATPKHATQKEAARHALPEPA